MKIESIDSSPFFKSTQIEIKSWSHFLELVHEIQERSGYNGLVWRGLGSSSFGLTSSLHRRLNQDLKTIDVDEFNSLDAERMLIRDLRLAWNPQERQNLVHVFAQMQHRGAVSRLIDVTRDPYYALWFALWASQKSQTDARVVGFFVGSQWDHFEPGIEEGSGYPDWINDESWPLEDYPQKTYFWFPSADLDVRVLAQKGGFIYGPMPFPKKHFKDAPAGDFYPEVRHHSSLDIELISVLDDLPEYPEGLAFSFLVPIGLRDEFFEKLRRHFGINERLMFPGFDGFVDSVRAAMTPISGRYGAEYPCC